MDTRRGESAQKLRTVSQYGYLFKDDCPAEAHIMLQISAHPISKERTRPGHVIQRGHVQIQARYI